MNEGEKEIQRIREEYLRTMFNPFSAVILILSLIISIVLAISSIVFIAIKGMYRLWELRFLWMSLGNLVSSLVSFLLLSRLNRKIDKTSQLKIPLIFLMIIEALCFFISNFLFFAFIDSIISAD